MLPLPPVGAQPSNPRNKAYQGTPGWSGQGLSLSQVEVNLFPSSYSAQRPHNRARRLPEIKGSLSRSSTRQEEYSESGENSILPHRRIRYTDDNEIFRLPPLQRPRNGPWPNGPPPPLPPVNLSRLSGPLLLSSRRFQSSRDDNLNRPSICYPGNGGVFEVGDHVKLVPVVLGVVDEFSIDPALPTNLIFSSETATIYGTAQIGTGARAGAENTGGIGSHCSRHAHALMNQTSYVVTARNVAGESSTRVALTIVPKLRTLSYQDFKSCLYVGEGVTFSADVKDVGSAEEFSVSPNLPMGMSLDPITGDIHGIPSAPVEQAVYEVVARNATSSVSCTVSFTVVANAQLDLHLNTQAASTEAGTSATKGTSKPKKHSLGKKAALKPRNLKGSKLDAVDEASEFPTLKYPYSLPIELTCEQAIELSPVVTGLVDSFSIQPQLPRGLEIVAATGVISGTPTTVTPETTYEVRASTASGDTTATVTIIVSPSLAYPGPLNVYRIGEHVVLSPLAQSQGAFQEYSIEPALPQGLLLDRAAGVISGTPTAISPEAAYTVSARNASGDGNATVTIVVSPSLAYPGYQCFDAYRVGEHLVLSPLMQPADALEFVFSVEPALPQGLSLDCASGVVSGAPLVVSNQTTYNVKASSVAGDTLASLTFSVVERPTIPTLRYEYRFPIVLTCEKAIHFSPTVKGVVENFSIQPQLPSGLEIDRTTGVISGTPSVASKNTTYRVKASNIAGEAFALLTFSVQHTVVANANAQLSAAPIEIGESSMIEPLKMEPVIMKTGPGLDNLVKLEMPAGIALNTHMSQSAAAAASSSSKYTAKAKKQHALGKKTELKKIAPARELKICKLEGEDEGDEGPDNHHTPDFEGQDDEGSEGRDEHLNLDEGDEGSEGDEPINSNMDEGDEGSEADEHTHANLREGDEDEGSEGDEPINCNMHEGDEGSQVDEPINDDLVQDEHDDEGAGKPGHINKGLVQDEHDDEGSQINDKFEDEDCWNYDEGSETAEHIPTISQIHGGLDDDEGPDVFGHIKNGLVEDEHGDEGSHISSKMEGTSIFDEGLETTEHIHTISKIQGGVDEDEGPESVGRSNGYVSDYRGDYAHEPANDQGKVQHGNYFEGDEGDEGDDGKTSDTAHETQQTITATTTTTVVTRTVNVEVAAAVIEIGRPAAALQTKTT